MNYGYVPVGYVRFGVAYSQTVPGDFRRYFKAFNMRAANGLQACKAVCAGRDNPCKFTTFVIHNLPSIVLKPRNHSRLTDDI